MSEDGKKIVGALVGAVVGYLAFQIFYVCAISSKMEESLGVSIWDIISYQ